MENLLSFFAQFLSFSPSFSREPAPVSKNDYALSFQFVVVKKKIFSSHDEVERVCEESLNNDACTSPAITVKVSNGASFWSFIYLLRRSLL